MKHKIIIEHADGRKEKTTFSTPIALVLAHRLLQSGYPWCSIYVDGHELGKETDCSNVFITTDNQRVII